MTQVTLNMCDKCLIPIADAEVKTSGETTYQERVIKTRATGPFEETRISTAIVIPVGIYHSSCFHQFYED